jgi:hypothetical protein
MSDPRLLTQRFCTESYTIQVGGYLVSRKTDMRRAYWLARSVHILVALSSMAISIGLMAFPAAANDSVVRAPSFPESAPPKPSRSYKPYFVEFRSRRAASYGHMYVLYGEVNAQGEIVESDIAGLHPKGDANDCANCSLIPWTMGHLLFVPSETGASDGDLEEKYVTDRYRVMLDAAAFNKIAAYIQEKKNERPLWNALVNNCVTFGNDIAAYIGLKTPAGANLLKPEVYIDSLREMNGGEPQEALRFAEPASSNSTGLPPPSAPSKKKKKPLSPPPAIEVSGATR